jgi:hypothetical protein
MSELSDMMAQDAAQTRRAPNDEDLKVVSDLANEQLRLENEVEEQGAKLKTLTEQLAKVRELDLPNALEKFGLLSITLLDKSKIVIKEDVYASISAEHHDQAMEWLEVTNNDGIVKNDVKVPFGKGQDAEAKQLVDLLTAQGYSFTNTRNVHPQTLKAFVRRQLEEGLPVPTDIFSIFTKRVASIVLPKVRHA